MSKPKREKFTATTTPEKNRPGKLFFQVEGELTPSAIGGDRALEGLVKTNPQLKLIESEGGTDS